MKRSAATSPAEQKSFAEELDRRLAERTAELTAIQMIIKFFGN